jgi:hypothetical protein
MLSARLWQALAALITSIEVCGGATLFGRAQRPDNRWWR